MRPSRNDLNDPHGLMPDLRLPLHIAELTTSSAETRAQGCDKSPFSSSSVKEGNKRVSAECIRGSHTPTLRAYGQQASVYQHAKILTTMLGPNISSSTNQSNSLADSVEVIVSELENLQDESEDLLTAREDSQHTTSQEASEASDTELVIRQYIKDRDRTLSNFSEATQKFSEAPDLSVFIPELKAVHAQEEIAKAQAKWLLKQQVLKMMGHTLEANDASDSENSIVRTRKATTPKVCCKDISSRSKSASKNKAASNDLQESPTKIAVGSPSRLKNKQIITLALSSLVSTNGISRVRLDEAMKALTGYRGSGSFVILFSSAFKEDYAGLYHLEDNAMLRKLCGDAIYPSVLDSRMIQQTYRFDTVKQCFKKLPSRGLSLGTDAASLVSRRSFY